MATLQATRPTDRPPAATRTPRGTTRRVIKGTAITVGVLVAVAALLSIAANAAVSAFAAHDHGSLTISLDGEPVDLDQPRFHDLDPQFHVHEGQGNLWHHHPANLTRIFSFEPMTLRQALEAIGAEPSEDTFAFDRQVYDLSDPAVRVTVRVNGEAVDPDGHVIADGDDITVQVVSGR